MKIDSIKFKGHPCFKNEWSGFDELKRINVIIGRNNTGKSRLLELVPFLLGGKRESAWQGQFSSLIDDRRVTSAWQHLWQKRVYWTERLGSRGCTGLEVPGLLKPIPEGVERNLAKICGELAMPFVGYRFQQLHADRDIVPERASLGSESLGRNGEGATNLIQSYITRADRDRDLIQKLLLSALNEVFGEDATFTEIQARRVANDEWEVFLGEEHKGLVPLSSSGSGLKTIILVLLNLLVIPAKSKKDQKFIFAFEELENNLHPGLFRRLLRYLEEYAKKHDAVLFLTTHSSVALDTLGPSPDAQIISVSHDSESASTRTIQAHFDKIGLVSELGARPSDLLQANGIVWVEGPSDCVYLNKWISLVSDGELQEGRHYQCAFYGGSLLARAQFTSEEEAEEHVVNLFRINPNIVVVCDSDRAEPEAPLKPRVAAVGDQVKKIPRAHLWVTQAREIENYLPGRILAKVMGEREARDPAEHESFFPRKDTASYAEEVLGQKSLLGSKIELAIATTNAPMTLEEMKLRFDWFEQVSAIVDAIRQWNR